SASAIAGHAPDDQRTREPPAPAAEVAGRRRELDLVDSRFGGTGCPFVPEKDRPAVRGGEHRVGGLGRQARGAGARPWRPTPPRLLRGREPPPGAGREGRGGGPRRRGACGGERRGR